MSYLTLRREETPRYEGAPAATPYRLSTDRFYYAVRSGRLSAGPTYIDRSDELRGQLSPASQLVDRYEPAGSIGIRAALNSLPPLLEMAGLVATITPGGVGVMDPDDNPVPAGAFLWQFSKRPGSTAASAEILAAYTEAGTFELGQGYGVSSLGFPANGEITAELMGLVCKGAPDPGLMPSYDAMAIEPLRSRHLMATWDTGTAEITEFSAQIANPLERITHYGIRSAYPGLLEMGEWVRLTGSASLHRHDPALRDAMLEASTFSARASWVSAIDIGATEYPYAMWIEMPACQITGGQGPDELSGRRRFGAAYDWSAAYDEVAGHDFRLTLACAVDSTETYAA